MKTLNENLNSNKAFTLKYAKLLVKNGIAQRYRLGICLESGMSIQSATQFMENNILANSDQFYSVFIRYHSSFHNELQEFLSEYIKRGFDLEAIEFEERRKVRK